MKTLILLTCLMAFSSFAQSMDPCSMYVYANKPKLEKALKELAAQRKYHLVERYEDAQRTLSGDKGCDDFPFPFKTCGVSVRITQVFLEKDGALKANLGRLYWFKHRIPNVMEALYDEKTGLPICPEAN